MKYNRIFVHSEPFDEVGDRIFRMIDQAPCGQCGCLTYFLDYTRANRPKYICSDACLYDHIDEEFGELKAPEEGSL